ncbi:MAG: V-type ATP synthase subunit D [Actinobacteria bacterium]|nr:V-type ATP synthase subunit D [Actinomycetota bacterium]
MEQVHPTRSELLKRKANRALAEQGMNLLKRKRDALLQEFMPIIDETMRLSLRLERVTADAQYDLAMAKAKEGGTEVRSASFASQGDVLVDITGTHVMGVPIPVIRKGQSTMRSKLKRGFGITGVSSRVDSAAEKFEEIIDVIIESADIETRLRRLGEELRKTNRRVNALENIVIPDFDEQIKFIEMSLEERMREDIFRLKKVKKALERKEEARLERLRS